MEERCATYFSYKKSRQKNFPPNYHFTLAKAFEIPKDFAQKQHFTLVKLLKFQETFLEKFLVSGFGAEAPTDNAHKKHGIAVLFLFLSSYVGTAVRGPCFKGLSPEKPLKNPQKLFRNAIYFYVIAFVLRFRKKCIIITLQTQSVCIEEIKKLNLNFKRV